MRDERTVMLNPSLIVILSAAKNLTALRVNSVKHLVVRFFAALRMTLYPSSLISHPSSRTLPCFV